MNEAFKDLAEIIKFGIKTEIEGQQFYSRLARVIKNPEARKKIESLARDEVIHEQRLRDLYKQFVGGEITDLPAQGLAIFKDAFGEKPPTEEDKYKYLDMAIEAELQSARFYKQGEDKATDPEMRKVFAELVAEEDAHYNTLMAEREGLRGNIHWFSYDGSAMLED